MACDVMWGNYTSPWMSTQYRQQQQYTTVVEYRTHYDQHTCVRAKRIRETCLNYMYEKYGELPDVVAAKPPNCCLGYKRKEGSFAALLAVSVRVAHQTQRPEKKRLCKH